MLKTSCDSQGVLAPGVRVGLQVWLCEIGQEQEMRGYGRSVVSLQDLGALGENMTPSQVQTKEQGLNQTAAGLFML